jgi:hypothetical protein
VDNVALFIRPPEHDLLLTNHILGIFGEASGLMTNINKTEYFPIQCGSTNLSFLTSRNLAISNFPCKYLGLPCISRSPQETCFSHLCNRLPRWKRDLLSYPGREILAKSILFAIPTYFLSIFKMRNWVITSIDKIRRAFLWKGQEVNNVSGEHCLVN